ncbi:helix-turn-helix domain-containing protein [Aetokthonos hydrillicola Thurmond2011]|jgi:putative transcriptional regulator|uniref:Helix-turn-helix domain-containing protein n=1 Tax=Aetokthonos hydrillicola Thurmond2011 TaxID=2712845 RepID=A0AAP5M8E5_9CYAN|nr:helix-turn-helix domain-containing protein [Aetokthonos hydrillicola]MDR9896165.1 helix-turn-helix domain-containing protein [Aetokthonos hydrillicola Thurmond2011]
MNETIITARMNKDGTAVEVLADGSERPFPKQPMRHMTEEEILAAAQSDPDAQPLTDADLARMKRVPRVKIIRRALGLTQEEFAARYHIPIGTLRDWEQGRSEPDQTAKAYLKVIAANPEAIYQALQFSPR